MTVSVATLGEKRIIREIIAPATKGAQVELGVGDDAAVVAFPVNERLVISSDKIPEDLLAIQLGLMDAFHHGRYLATVNISDIAAMGAKPLGLLCTLALPDTFELEYLKTFIRGFVAGGAEWGAPVVGGDTGWASCACLSATAFGSIEKGINALTRGGAMIGDQIFTSGEVGGFGAALAYFVAARPRGLLLSESEEEWLRERLIRPVARVDVGRSLLASGSCTSCIDITDGVGQSLREIAEASGVCLQVETNSLPVNPITRKVASLLGCDLETIVFGIGLDLQLLGTLSSQKSSAYPTGLHVFGQVVAGEQGVILNSGGKKTELKVRGWQHFKGAAMDLVRTTYSATSRPSNGS
jgi:thiamine-monophosphate kinase